ncbi:hypothetical protein PBRA_002369 [Plasmodiophora brassicae]|uniref:Uncharacterized protein n=1 Tax=Plasmodiophora brassicae TaxID=37360 RepID=A0A0G4J451_PLABS|nr:hypothetical protein PBRA_002369 [Plasmodiophora brassicae]
MATSGWQPWMSNSVEFMRLPFYANRLQYFRCARLKEKEPFRPSKRYHMDAFVTVKPPGGRRMKRRDFIDIWQRCESVPALAGSRPFVGHQGGFAWERDFASLEYLEHQRVDDVHDQQLQFCFVQSPWFKDTWAACRDAWHDSMDAAVPYMQPVFTQLLIKAKWGIAGERIMAFRTVLRALRWSIVDCYVVPDGSYELRDIDEAIYDPNPPDFKG